MKSMPTTRKPKGAVLLDKSGQPVTNKTANPQRAEINQAQGPRMGNTGTPAKQSAFIKEKASSSTEKSALANMVMDALAGRGAGMKGLIDPTVEPLSPNTGPKRNPTAGGTQYKTTSRKK
jgi:hypothetical protein